MEQLNINDQRSGDERRALPSKKPWYVEPALKIGAPMILLGGMIYWLTQSVDASLADLLRDGRTHFHSSQLYYDSDKELKNLIIDSLSRQENYNRRICENTARSDAAREGCRNVR